MSERRRTGRGSARAASSVAGIRNLADLAEMAAAERGPPTVQAYAQALRDQRHVTMDAGAHLVPAASESGLGWSPAGSGRRRS